MDALTMLKQDHQKVKRIFGELEGTEDPRTRKALFGELMKELTMHERIEEEIFYPAVEERAREKKTEELLVESYVEHAFVNTISQEILKTDYAADVWAAKLKVMKENVEHHAFEEEEGKLFPKVEKLFSADELEELGEEMMELKEEAQEDLELKT
jgi:hemerythrin superfamily protein